MRIELVVPAQKDYWLALGVISSWHVGKPEREFRKAVLIILLTNPKADGLEGKAYAGALASGITSTTRLTLCVIPRISLMTRTA